MSAGTIRTPTSSGSCRPTATAAISAPPSAAARSNFDYLQPDRAGGRRARLLRRAAADRAKLRGFLGRRLGARAADRAAALPGRGAARPAVAERRRAHDRDARPALERAAADQRRHRRRSGREQGRRHLPRPRRALRSHRTSSSTSISALLAGETVNFNGKHIRIEDGRLLFPPVQKPHPPLYFGGSSAAGIEVAAEHVDKYLTWGEPPAQVAEKIAACRRVAAARGPQAVASASACTSSCARPTTRPGRRPTS